MLYWLLSLSLCSCSLFSTLTLFSIWSSSLLYPIGISILVNLGIDVPFFSSFFVVEGNKHSGPLNLVTLYIVFNLLLVDLYEISESSTVEFFVLRGWKDVISGSRHLGLLILD